MNAATTGGGQIEKEFSIATWNVNCLRVRGEQLMQWLRDARPDVVALQETKTQDPDFPHPEFTAAGYHSVFSGQKTYNGVALLSRLPMTDLVRDIPDFDDPPRRVLAATIATPLGHFRIINLYVPNGQAPGSEKFAYKLKWFAALTRWLEKEAAHHPGLVVLGDFNVAPEDRDVHDPAAWVGCVHVSPEERAALQGVTEARPGGRLPSFRAAGKIVQLVGLSPGRLSAKQWPAHRSHSCASSVAAFTARLSHRQGATARRAGLGSHARSCIFHRRRGRGGMKRRLRG